MLKYVIGFFRNVHVIDFIKNCERITRDKCCRNSFSEIVLENALFVISKRGSALHRLK